MSRTYLTCVRRLRPEHPSHASFEVAGGVKDSWRLSTELHRKDEDDLSDGFARRYISHTSVDTGDRVLAAAPRMMRATRPLPVYRTMDDGWVKFIRYATRDR